MKALVYTDTLNVEYRDEPNPVPGPGEALVQIEAVGICGSDMHAYHGRDERRVPPLILGHEASGRVLSGQYAGQRVVLNPLMTCGRCGACRSGRTNLCSERELVGMRVPGAFAEQIAVPERNLLPIPPAMDAVVASLTEPTATAWHALAMVERILFGALAQARVLILGGGSIGVLTALLLRQRGCRQIVLADTNPLRRQTAAALQCAEVYDPSATAPDAQAFEVVVDAVGSGATRAAATRCVKPGGVISHIGLADNEPGLDTRTLTLSEITFVGHYTYTPYDLRASIEVLASEALGPIQWIETRALAEGAQAFRDLHHGHTRAQKIVLIPNP